MCSRDPLNQLTRQQAIEFYETGKWELMSARERANWQLYQEFLCMPFDKFHEAVEITLERSVFTHEFCNLDALRAELIVVTAKLTAASDITKH